MNANFYSQCGEDKWIEENLKPAVGTFCEVGAHNGIDASNTLHFEQIGWRGIAVEADPRLAAECFKNRKAAVWCCAAGLRRLALFNINEDDRFASGLTRPGKVMPVIVCPLSHMLHFSGFSELGLLSVDTEGTELEVWQSIGKIRPHIVIMEHQTFNEPSQIDAIVMQMTADGYKEVHRTAYNLIFTSKESKGSNRSFADGNVEGVPDAPKAAPRPARSSPRQNPPSPEALFEQGAFGEAADLYQKIFQANPSNIEALFRQAECRFQQGHSTLARLLFEDLLRSNPEHPAARKRLLELKSAPAKKAAVSPPASDRMAATSVP